MSENRTGQWFVNATDSTRWFGPVTEVDHKMLLGNQSFKGCGRWGIQEWEITAGNYLRIPPRLDLPPGLTTRECRLPKKGERYVDLNGKIRSAPMPYSDGLIGDYGWRRWIFEAEPEEEQGR